MRIIATVTIGWVGALLYMGPVSAGEPAGGKPELDPTQAVLANWLVQSRDGIIQISRAQDDTYQGRIVGGTDPHSLDSKNPDPAKRHDTIQGTIILTHLKYAGHSRWKDGRIYDPSSGKTYKCNLQLMNHDSLKIRGYIGVSLLGGSQLWSRYLGTQMVLTGPVPESR
jgi:uncharacterized protein (DUF2147 family)